MPRGRPKKQLQAIQEDEVLEDVEEQEECAPAIDEDKLRVIQKLEAEGTPASHWTYPAQARIAMYIPRCAENIHRAAVQDRANALLAMAEAQCRSILHDFTVQLMKLPKQASHSHGPSLLCKVMSLSSSACNSQHAVQQNTMNENALYCLQ